MSATTTTWRDTSLRRVERRAAEVLGTPAYLEVADAATGRRDALQRVLARAALAAEVDALRFPHANVSLTHAAGLVIACAVPGRVAGVGVDYEADRIVGAGAARVVLSTAERAALCPCAPDDASTVLRLWTVKEALFKADPDNHARTVVSYRVLRPDERSGEGVTPAGRVLHRFSARFAGGWLSVAVCPAESTP